RVHDVAGLDQIPPLAAGPGWPNLSSLPLRSRPMIHAICVAGARPNLIKIKPVIDALESLGAKTTFVHTGQHYDEAMSGVFLNDLGLRQPDLSLGVGSGTHAEQTARVMVAFEPVVGELCPDVVVVVGGGNSTLG